MNLLSSMYSLQSGMGFSSNQAILLSAPVGLLIARHDENILLTSMQPYYYAVIPVLLSSRFGDSEFLQKAYVEYTVCQPDLTIVQNIDCVGLSSRSMLYA